MPTKVGAVLGAKITEYIKAHPEARPSEIARECGCSSASASAVRRTLVQGGEVPAFDYGPPRGVAVRNYKTTGERRIPAPLEDDGEALDAPDPRDGRIAELHELIADLSLDNVRLRRLAAQ